jgi:hypothetical protein
VKTRKKEITWCQNEAQGINSLGNRVNVNPFAQRMGVEMLREIIVKQGYGNKN